MRGPERARTAGLFDQLHAAHRVGDMAQPPGNRLDWDLWHELQRGAQTYSAIRQRPPRAARGAARHTTA